jgi:hypothetical protein
VVHDEALSYLQFLQGSWPDLFTHYTANNHILNSILVKASIGALGLSELTLRLPNVIGGFFFALGVYWALEKTASRPIRWIAFVALCLHPLLLDFSVAARGYGLGVAFLVWAVYFSMRQRAVLAGVLLGLGISANLTVVYPALALIAAAALTGRDGLRTRVRTAMSIALPALAIFTILCGRAMQKAEVGNFYAGLPTIALSLESLILTSVHGSQRGTGFFGTGEDSVVLRLYVLPIVAGLIVFASGYRVWRKKVLEASLIPALALSASVVGILLSHLMFGLPYPTDRTGLPLILLFGLTWAIAAEHSPGRGPRAVHIALALAMLAQFGSQFETRQFEVWFYDAKVKEVAQRIQDLSRGLPPQSARIGATWIHQPALEFYRQYLGIGALRPVLRIEPTPLSGYDFYVLNDPDRDRPEAARMQLLFSDPISRIALLR